MIIQENLNRASRKPLALVASFAVPVLVVGAFAGSASAGSSPTFGDFVSYECSDSGDVEGPYLVVDVPEGTPGPDSDPTILAGPKPDILVFAGLVADEYLAEAELDPYTVVEGADTGESSLIEVEPGSYTVVLDYPPGYKELAPTASPNIDQIDFANVSCGKKPRVKVNVTTPPLPKTGGGTEPALVIAPIALLAGGALLVVRRRFAVA